MLEIKNLYFSVADSDSREDILAGIDLTVESGKFIVITGPNGSGKTTLARSIMGLVQPTSGAIVLDGEDITNLDITERAKLGVSYSFQQPPRFKGLTVNDLLTVAAGREMRRDEACTFLTQVGLCAMDYIGREVNSSLSGGEVKRIEIATLLARDSKLMIFDEPEAGIDLWSFSRLTETFSRIHKKSSATIIIISHQERIISMADEVILLDGGKVSDRGTPEEILPKIVGGTFRVCDALTESEV